MPVVSRVSKLRIESAADPTGIFRQWLVTATTQDTAAGGSVSVQIDMTVAGATPPGEAETLTLRYVNDSGGVIRTVTLNATAASQSDTFHFTDTGTSGGTARCGTVEMKLQATRATAVAYDIETDGAPNTTPAGFNSVLDRGWVRGTTTLVEDLTATGTPAQYADTITITLTSGAVSYVARALTYTMSPVASSVSGSTNSTTAAARTATETVNTRFNQSSTDVGISATVPNATLTGLPDWTYTSTTDDTVTVDSSVTVDQLTAGEATTTVCNRGDRSPASGTHSVRVRGARGVGFTPIGGTNQIAIIDNPSSAVEERSTTDGGVLASKVTVVSANTSTGVITFHLTFATSGNAASSDGTGRRKDVRWRDTNASGTVTSNSPTPAAVGPLTNLDSTYVVRRHLQVNNNSTIETANTEVMFTRLVNELGFYTFQVRNRRAEAISGIAAAAGLEAWLQDDASLVSAVKQTALGTTDANGYWTLKAWDNPLPLGGWDLWLSNSAGANNSMTHNGNTISFNRKAVSSSDFTLDSAAFQLDPVALALHGVISHR